MGNTGCPMVYTHFARSTDPDGHRLLLSCQKGIHLLPWKVSRIKSVCLRLSVANL